MSEQENIVKWQERAAAAEGRLSVIGEETAELEKKLGITRMNGGKTDAINAKLAKLASEKHELTAELAALSDAITAAREAITQAEREAAAAEFNRITGELVPMSLEAWKALDSLHIHFCKMAALYEQARDAQTIAGKLVEVDERVIEESSIGLSWQSVNAAMTRIIKWQGVAWLEQFGMKMPDLEGEYNGTCPIAPREAGNGN